MTILSARICVLVLAWWLVPRQQAVTETITPVLLEVRDAPVAFAGSDGKTHLVYELRMTNFSSGNAAIEQVEVIGDAGAVLKTMDKSEIAGRLQMAGQRTPTDVLPGSAEASLFIHATLADGAAVPAKLTHRVRVRVEAAPPGKQELTEAGGETAVDRQAVAVIGPPLRGTRYVAADSCCDASRHTRAALPVNGRVWIAQRYAVDWEQLDDEGRIYHGPRADVKSYTIYRKEVLAVADATVASTIEGMENETPGKMPENIAIEKADGNSVVLDLGGGRYALYAHLDPGSVRVHKGDTVKRGQVIGLVGNTGNSLAPHLHFHVMSRAVPLASNGLPYEIDDFLVTASTPGTAAFDAAEEKGTPLATTLISPPRHAKNEMPLDQMIISFGP
jgi:murein DD-endopeptidase MepM/ murein hydrolase activator NlpD